MKEQVLRLGSHGGLVGVLGRSSEEGNSETAVVFLNAGMLPRTGPYRMHVEAGRRISSLGYDHLRLDQANLGDSRERPHPECAVERAFLDVGDTLDHLQKTFGYRRFVLVGLCAGAFTALLYAPRDSRVAGVVLLDPPTVATIGFRFRKFLHLFAFRRWRNFFLRRMRVRSRKGIYSPQLANPPSNPLSREASENALRAGLGNGTRFLFVCTGDSPFPYNSEKQLAELYPSLMQDHSKEIEQVWLPRATHLYSFREDRLEMMEHVETWIQKYF